jgi:hypothetical protein
VRKRGMTVSKALTSYWHFILSMAMSGSELRAKDLSNAFHVSNGLATFNWTLG